MIKSINESSLEPSVDPSKDTIRSESYEHLKQIQELKLALQNGSIPQHLDRAFSGYRYDHIEDWKNNFPVSAEICPCYSYEDSGHAF